MILAGQLLIGTLDLLFIRALVNAQHFIIIAFSLTLHHPYRKIGSLEGAAKRSPIAPNL